MKHRIGYNRIGRKASHRKALIKNMVTQLYRYERIRTTKVKALEVRRRAEKLITRAKEDTVHNRRIVAKLIHDKEILAKLFTEIAPNFAGRPGGYTRILKLGYRKGDAAEMVLLELVGRDETPVSRRRKARTATAATAKPDAEPATAQEAAEETVQEANGEVPDEQANDVEAGAEESKAASPADDQSVEPESSEQPEVEAESAVEEESEEPEKEK